MLVIIYSKLLILDVRQKDTKSYRPPLVRALSDAQETAFEQLRLHLKLVSEGEEELPTDFIRQLGNYSPKLKITLDLISRDPSKYLRSIWFLPLPSKSIPEARAAAKVAYV